MTQKTQNHMEFFLPISSYSPLYLDSLGQVPSLYECIDKAVIENNAKRWVAKQRKDDAIEAVRQADKHFCKVMTLKQRSILLAENGTAPLPIDNAIVEAVVSQISHKPPYCLLTVNPKPGVVLSDFKRAVEKFLSKKKSVGYYIQCYEVRKGEEGLHSHILLEYKGKPFEFKRSTKNTFKNICDVENNNILNFKFLTEDLLADKCKYILGEKQAKKMSGVKDTIKYRLKYNLKSIAESSPPFPCRATQITIPGEAELIDCD